MAARFEAHLMSAPAPIPESEARAMLTEAIPLITAAGPNEEVDFGTVRIIDRDTPEGLAALMGMDVIAVILEGSDLEQSELADPVASAARMFLSEPRYAAGGNYYMLRDWVTAAMFGGQSDALYGMFYRMWNGGWQVCIDGDNSTVLAKRHVGPLTGIEGSSP